MFQRISISVLLGILLVSCVPSGPKSDFNGHDVILQDYVWHTIVDSKPNDIKLTFTLDPLKPVPDDIKIYKADLNNDGKPDFIATVDNFLYRVDGKYPLYVMIADEYGYHQLPGDLRTADFTISTLDSVTSGYRDFTASGHKFTFDGKGYVETK